MSGRPYWQHRDILVAALLGIRFAHTGYEIEDVAPQNKENAYKDVDRYLKDGDPSVLTPEELSYIDFIDEIWNY